MKFVIGEKIKEKLEERGVTQKAFASAIGMTTRNLERFFERSDISINQLLKASDFLNYDFVSLYIENSKFKEYVEELGKPIVQSPVEKILKIEQPENQITFSLNLKGSFDAVSKEMPNFLTTIKKEAEKRGFQLV